MTDPFKSERWPAMMKRTTAARYCDLAPGKFLQEVACGRLHYPVHFGGSDHWSREKLDEDFRLLFDPIGNWQLEQPGLNDALVAPRPTRRKRSE